MLKQHNMYSLISIIKSFRDTQRHIMHPEMHLTTGHDTYTNHYALWY